MDDPSRRRARCRGEEAVVPKLDVDRMGVRRSSRGHGRHFQPGVVHPGEVRAAVERRLLLPAHDRGWVFPGPARLSGPPVHRRNRGPRGDGAALSGPWPARSDSEGHRGALRDVSPGVPGSPVLAGEQVALEAVADAIWSVHLDDLLLGRLDARDYRMRRAHTRNRVSPECDRSPRSQVLPMSAVCAVTPPDQRLRGVGPTR